MPTGSALSAAAVLVRGGGVIAYPTDTVWGIGGDARRPDVVARCRALKGRGRQPMLVLVDDAARIEAWVAWWPDGLRAILEARLAATVLLPASPGAPSALVGPGGEIGVRCPAGWVGALCAEIEAPLLSTSANRSGASTPTARGALGSEITRGVDSVADGPEPAAGLPSTLVRADDGSLVVLRAGAASTERITKATGLRVRTSADR